MNNYNKLMNNLESLKLDKIKDYYPGFVDKATKDNLSLTEALYELTQKEIEYRDEGQVRYRYLYLHSPTVKS